MKFNGLLLLPFFLTSLVTAQQQGNLKNDMLKITEIWQESQLSQSNSFQKYIDRFPKVNQQTKPAKNSFALKSKFSSMPIHRPKGNFKLRIIPVDTIQQHYLKIYSPN